MVLFISPVFVRIISIDGSDTRFSVQCDDGGELRYVPHPNWRPPSQRSRTVNMSEVTGDTISGKKKTTLWITQHFESDADNVWSKDITE